MYFVSFPSEPINKEAGNPIQNALVEWENPPSSRCSVPVNPLPTHQDVYIEKVYDESGVEQ